jgi:hypothetical protein
VLPFACAILRGEARKDAVHDVLKLCDNYTIALTFLETKLYGDELWSIFIASYQKTLLERAQPNRDTEWLREVHLFLVAAADAERSATLIHGIKRTDQVTDFFRHLAAESDTAIAQLIRSYAEQDAAGAFRIATLFGIDVVGKIPQIVVENADQPPFLEVAVERASKDIARAADWAALFAEAGLRSPATASALVSRQQMPWAEAALPVSKRHQWTIPHLMRNSFYTDCLCLGIDADFVRPDTTPLLEKLREIPAPNRNIYEQTCGCFARYYYQVFWFFYISMGALAAVSLLDTFYFYLVFSRGGLILLYLAAIDVLLLFTVMLFYHRQSVKYRIYAAILNISLPVWSSVFPVTRHPTSGNLTDVESFRKLLRTSALKSMNIDHFYLMREELKLHRS